MSTTAFTKYALAAALAVPAVTGLSTASFAAHSHHRHHHSYGYAYHPYSNVPGASRLDPCGDICDSAIVGGGS